ncbi:hypothetical protein BG004_000934, partial [Podila humilis]
ATARHRRFTMSLKSTFILLCVAVSPSLIVAQSGWTPVTTWGMTSIFQEGQSLLVNGGSNNTETIPQTFALDLSSPWATSSPKFTQLPDGPNDYKHASALLKDKQNWFVLSNGTGYQYNIPTKVWKSLGRSKYVSTERGLPGTTDPVTGYVYIPNAIVNGTTLMLQYDVPANLLRSLPMETTLNRLVSYSVAWSAQASQMVVFGGAISGTNNVQDRLFTWSPSGSGWTTPSTHGDIPSARRSHCMVPADNGNKMILFGGLTDQSNSVLSDVYVYDVATYTWTKGTDAGPIIARAEMACAVTNDLLVIWGGGGVNTAVTSEITAVYNWKQRKWQKNYSPVASPDPDGNGTNGGGGDADSDDKSNTGAIIGGVVAGLAVIGLAIGLFFYRKKKNGHTQVPTDDSSVQKPSNAQFENQQYPHPQGQQQLNYAPVSGQPAMQQVNGSEPWQQQQQQSYLQQQQQQQHAFQTPIQHQIGQPIMYSQGAYVQGQTAAYTPYQPPIIQDLSQMQNQDQQQQHTPQIFQPQYTAAGYEPPMMPIKQSPSLDYEVPHPQPEIYHPPPAAVVSGSEYSSNAYATVDGMTDSVTSPAMTSNSAAVSKPLNLTDDISSSNTPPTTYRPPQNPQYVTAVPDSYQDDDYRRNPQSVSPSQQPPSSSS